MRSFAFVKLLPLVVVVAACEPAQAAPLAPDPPGSAAAVFAGGCFWCLEADFEKLDGVLAAVSGYAGGPEENPTYKQVSAGRTGHAEVVRVVYDPKKVTYEQLVEYFWRHVDPTQRNGQFCDHGPQYRTAIYPLDDDQKKKAEASKAALVASGKLPAPVVTEITKITVFWPAEEYHQDFYKKEPMHYVGYRRGCGRDARVEQLWGKPAKP